MQPQCSCCQWSAIHFRGYGYFWLGFGFGTVSVVREWLHQVEASNSGRYEDVPSSGSCMHCIRLQWIQLIPDSQKNLITFLLTFTSHFYMYLALLVFEFYYNRYQEIASGLNLNQTKLPVLLHPTFIMPPVIPQPLKPCERACPKLTSA